MARLHPREGVRLGQIPIIISRERAFALVVPPAVHALGQQVGRPAHIPGAKIRVGKIHVPRLEFLLHGTVAAQIPVIAAGHRQRGGVSHARLADAHQVNALVVISRDLFRGFGEKVGIPVEIAEIPRAGRRYLIIRPGGVPLKIEDEHIHRNFAIEELLERVINVGSSPASPSGFGGNQTPIAAAREQTRSIAHTPAPLPANWRRASDKDRRHCRKTSRSHGRLRAARSIGPANCRWRHRQHYFRTLHRIKETTS